MAGVLFVHHQHGLSNAIGGNPFSPEASLRVFSIAVIGGLGSIPGAIIGTIYVFTLQYYMLPEYRFLATGLRAPRHPAHPPRWSRRRARGGP